MRRFKPNEFSLLGTLAHEFREHVGTNNSLTSDQAVTIWNQLERQIIKKTMDVSNTGAPVPKASTWSKYSMTKSISIEQAIAKQDSISSGERVESSSTKFEEKIEPDIKPLIAIIDLLITSGSWSLIKDLKTGAPKDNHTDQVLFYASVFNEAFGRWPNKLMVEYFGTNESEIKIDEGLATNLTVEAINRRDIYNLRSNKGRSQFAKPSFEVCNYCTYRPICSSYLESDIVRDGNYSIAGVFSIEAGGVSGNSNRVTCIAGDIDEHEYVLLMPENSSIEFKAGQVIAINGLTKVNSAHTLRVDWNAVIWPLQSTVT